MLAACACGMAQGVDNEAHILHSDEGLKSLPGMFTVDGKSCIIISNAYYDGNDAGSFSMTLYDDEITPMQSFTLPAVENCLHYKIIDQREKLVIIYPDGYEDDRGFTGEWYQGREDYELKLGISCLYFTDFDEGSWDYDGYFYVTQTLFNDDERYEYIQPMFEYIVEKTETDRDGDGGIDYIETEYNVGLTGFKIMTTSGEELQRVDLDKTDYYDGGFYLLKINGKYYLYLYVGGEGDDYYTYFYRINRETSSIQQVGAPIKGMSVSPRTQGRGGSFTVELDGESNAEREVFVTDAAGRTVWRQTVPAGLKTVRISASRLGRGLNVVTVRGGKQGESCKVIVK